MLYHQFCQQSATTGQWKNMSAAFCIFASFWGVLFFKRSLPKMLPSVLPGGCCCVCSSATIGQWNHMSVDGPVVWLHCEYVLGFLFLLVFFVCPVLTAQYSLLTAQYSVHSTQYTILTALSWLLSIDCWYMYIDVYIISFDIMYHITLYTIHNLIYHVISYITYHISCDIIYPVISYIIYHLPHLMYHLSHVIYDL